MRAFPLSAAVLAALFGCAAKKTADNPPTGPAASVQYLDLAAHNGQRVRFRAWVLSEGDSYEATGDQPKYFLILVPEPKVDWGKIGDAEEECGQLVKSLQAAKPDASASAAIVAKFNRCATTAGAFSAMLKQEETAPGVLAWGLFPTKPLSAEYGLGTDQSDTFLDNPTNQRLLDAARSAAARIKHLLDSAELEMVGTPQTTEQWVKNFGEGGENIKAAVQTKQSIVTIESFKLLRTGHDLAAEAKKKRSSGSVN